MVVLSGFDGFSCGQIALRELNIKVDRYYASEIDKYAIKQTQLNFPNTIQLGDITRWREWNIDFSLIDLILAGSPCQGFSFAGKQLAFDDPRSKLFFVIHDIYEYVKSLNPNVKFLLENVNMKKCYMEVINRYMGVIPVNINSNLVSAQNRNRWYWTNIRTRKEGLFGDVYSDIPQPKDRKIFLKDILEDNVDGKYILSDKMVKSLIQWGDRNKRNGNGFHLEIKSENEKSCSLTTGSMKSTSTYIMQRPRGYNKGDNYAEKSPTIGCNSWEQNNLLKSKNIIRRLTPTECARLQTIPSWYKWECSDSQAYKMLGNGWTVEVIKHILNFLN